MSTKMVTVSAAMLGVSLLLGGCSNARDVEVTGEVAAASNVEVQGVIMLEFFDLIDESEPSSVKTATLSALGPFTQTLSVEGDNVLIRAINDRNGDGTCSSGEPWAEVESSITEDTVENVVLSLGDKPCPAAE